MTSASLELLPLVPHQQVANNSLWFFFHVEMFRPNQQCKAAILRYSERSAKAGDAFDLITDFAR